MVSAQRPPQQAFIAPPMFVRPNVEQPRMMAMPPQAFVQRGGPPLPEGVLAQWAMNSRLPQPMYQVAQMPRPVSIVLSITYVYSEPVAKGLSRRMILIGQPIHPE